ncbi:23S rRNA (adenine(2503)-C(2))-methyltransferase RlmN, partial [Georgenia sp. 10Sc9-8]|nr:23S rRNA (adenine(2503)-C(2))-methyltransferase RlmN [Georgenia halotolerans]
MEPTTADRPAAADPAPAESLDPAHRPQLSFTARRRGKPPRHLADLDRTERARVVQDAGMPAFRAEQVARHYFSHLTRDPADMSDLPAAVRADLTDTLLPELVTRVRDISADGGATVKSLWSLFDGAKVESV